MARSSLLDIKEDLVSDGGAVLWSMVTGEQLEFPVTLTFLNEEDVKNGVQYIYEAVVVEADNIELQTEKPKTIKPNGVQTTLQVRVPVFLGNWNLGEAYNWEEVVAHNNKYYKLARGAGYISNFSPDQDVNWVETKLNRIYIQFPEDLGAAWEVKGTIGSPVYGFFELRITEPSTPYFRRTWKPVRGMIELLFSPTELVPG